MIEDMIQAVGSRRPRRPSTLSCAFEALEARTLLALIAWDGGGDGASWHDSRNWAGDVLPASGDDAQIGAGFAGVDLVGSAAVRSLTSLSPFRIFRESSLVTERDASFRFGLTMDATSQIRAEQGAVVMSKPGPASVRDPVVEIAGGIRARAIMLDAGDSVLRVTGTLDVTSATGLGGTIDLFGRRAVLEGASLDASGVTGGGRIRIGGDYLGAPIAGVRNAEYAYLDELTFVRADALAVGSGGTVILWSDIVTGFYGRVSARGGISGGNGGFVETSGKVGLDASGAVDASAPAGAPGTWLLDPRSVTIGSGTQTGGAFSGGNPTTFTPTADNATINATTVSNSLGNGTSVVVTTGATGVQAGSITVLSAITPTGLGGSTLTLRAAGDIVISANLTTSTTSPVAFNLFANDATPGPDPNPATGNVLFSSAVTVSIGSGVLTVSGVSFSTPTTGTINAGTIAAVMSGDIQINGDMTATTAINLQSGSDGTGNLTFAAAGVDLAAPTITLRAGDGVGGAGTTAVADLNLNAPTFRRTSGGANRPDRFDFRQDSTITDANIPSAARFAAAIGGMVYNLQSDDGDITVNTASKVSGTNLDLIASGNASLNAALSGGTSLSLTADNDSNGSGTATITATQSLSALTVVGQVITLQGGISISVTNNVFALGTTATSTATLNSNISVVEGVIFVQAGTISIGGTSSSPAGMQFNAGAGGVTQTGGALTSDRLLVGSGGNVSLQASNDFNTIAGTTSAGSFSYNDVDDFAVDLVTISGSFAGIASTNLTSLSISGATGAIAINRAITAEIRVELNAPGGATTTAPGTINAPALRLLGGGAGAAYSLATSIQTLASSANATLNIVDQSALFVGTVAGTVGITSSGRDVFLTAGGGSGITINSPISINDGRMILTSDGDVTQGPTGSIAAAGNLLLQGNGNFILTNPANNVINLAASTGAGFVNYLDVDSLFISSIFGVPGVARNNDITITAGGSLTINQPVSAHGSVLTLASGASGVGNLTFGVGPGSLSLIGASISLVAGNGTGGGTTAFVDHTTNSPFFRGGSGGATNPAFFRLRQDAAIPDASIPALARFPLGNVANMNYSLESLDGAVTVGTAAKVASSNLSLLSPNLSTINTTLTLNSLSVFGPAAINAPTLSANQSLFFGGTTTLLIGSTLTAGAAGATFSDAVLGGPTRSLVVNTSGTTTLGNGSDVLSISTNAGGSTLIAGTFASTVIFNDAVSLNGPAQIATSGSATFNSTLSTGDFDFTINANEIDFNGGANSVSGLSTLALEPNETNRTINVFGAVNAATLDITTTDIAAVNSNFAFLRIGRPDATGPMNISGGTLRTGTTFVTSGIITASSGGITGLSPNPLAFSGGAINLGATIRAAGGGIALQGPVTLSAATVLDSTNLGAAPQGADVTFSSTVNGAAALSTNAGSTGITFFSDSVGTTVPLTSISITGTALVSGTLYRTSGPQNWGSSLVLSGSGIAATARFEAALITFGSVNGTVNGAQGIDAASGNVGFTGSVGNTNRLGSLVVSGNALFASGVSLSNAGGLDGSLFVGGLATLGGASDTVINFSTVGGTFTFNSGIVASSPGEQGLAVTGNLVTSGTAAGAVALRSLSVTGSTTIAGNGSIRTSSLGGGSGAQTYSNVVTVLGSIVFDLFGGDLSFASSVNLGAGSQTFRARGLSLGGTATGTGNLTIEPDLAAGNMLLGATDGPGGALDLSSLTLSRLSDGFASVTFGRADGSGTITIASAYNVVDPTTFRAPVAPGRVVVNAPLTASGNGSFTFIGSGSTTVLNADVRTNGAPILFNDAVLIGVPLVTIDTTGNGTVPAGAAITFNFSLNSENVELNGVLIQSGTGGTTTFAAGVGTAIGGRLSSITTDAGGVSRFASSLSANVAVIGDPVLLDGNATFTTQALTFGGTVNTSGNGSFGLSVIGIGPGASATFQAAVGNTLPLANLSTSANVLARFGASPVATTGAQSYSGPVELFASVTFVGGSVAFNAGVDGNGNALIVNSPGITAFGGVISELSTLTTNAPGVTQISASAITASSNITFTDAVVIFGDTTITSVSAVLTFASTLDIQESDIILRGAEINFFGAVTGTGSVQLLQANAAQNYNVAHATEGGGDALDITAGELNLFDNDIAAITFGDEDGAAIMDVEAYTFGSSIQINMPGVGGQIQVQGNIACADDTDSIGVRGNGSTTHLRGSIITRGGTITIDDSVLIEVSDVELITTAGNNAAGANVSILRRVNSATNLGFGLRVRAGLGNMTFGNDVGGAIGGLPGFLDVTAGGGTFLLGANFRTIGAQTYTGPVTLGPSVFIQTQGAPVTVTGGVDGNSNLTIGAGTGAVNFGGSVGGVTTLTSLTINSGATRIFAGAVRVQVLTVFGGNVIFNGLTELATGLLIAGTMGGSGDVFVDLPFTWVGGDMIGTGRTVIRQTGSLVISGGNPKTLSRTIENSGSTFWTDGNLNFAGGTFINRPTGQFFAQSSGAFQGVSGTNTFTNQGEFERSGAGLASLSNLIVSNSGTMRLASGDLNIAPAGASAFSTPGNLVIGAASKLNVVGSVVMAPTTVFMTALAGTAAGQFGQLVATGSVIVDGTLIATLANGFVPSGGDRFPIILGSSVTGTFDAAFLPTVAGRTVAVQYNPADVTITVASGIDFNGDGTVDADDLADFINAFFSTPPGPGTDFNGDGNVDADDLGDFINAFFG